MATYKVEEKLPKFLEYSIEKEFFTELLTTKSLPKIHGNTSNTKIRFLKNYLFTASATEAYNLTFGQQKDGQDLSLKLERLLRPHTVWFYARGIIYSAIKKVRRNDYMKLDGEIVDKDTIHPKFIEWIMTKDLFESKGINVDVDFYKTLNTKLVSHRIKRETYIVDDANNPIDPTTVDQRSRKIDANLHTRAALPEELINNAVKKYPQIAALHHAFEDLSNEDIRRKVIAAHITNLHFIAFDDEERTSDRINASKEVIKVMGGYEIDNRQKGQSLAAALEDSNIKEMLQTIKERSKEIQKYLPETEDAVVIDDPTDLSSVESEGAVKQFIELNNYKINNE